MKRLHEPNTIEWGQGNAVGHYVPNGTGLIASLRTFVDAGGTPAGLQVFLKARFILPGDDRVTESETSLVVTNDGAEHFLSTTLPECLLQSVHVYSSRDVTCHRGQCYAQVWIQFGIQTDTGTPILYTLCSDYVENIKPVSFPASGVKTSLIGQGAPNETIVPAGLSIAEANAALIAIGATQRIFTFTVPSHMRITPQFLHFKFTPSAGTPDIILAFVDVLGNVVALEYTPSMVNVGTAFVNFTNSTNNPATVLVFAAANIVTGKFPIFPMLTAGAQIIITSNDAGASTLGKLAFSYESWIDPQDAVTPSNPGNNLPNPPSGPA